MCAIAVLFGNLPKDTPSAFPNMIKAAAHRGPDDSGQLYFENVALGHRRLAIQDLSSAGHQPMSVGERYHLVFNGEIYNFLELKQELEEAGHVFHTRTDTEVVLKAFAQWDTDCFARFNGMWALALYDSQDKRLVLSRDRFGIKPLYLWAPADGLLAIASEIKQFTALPGWRAKLNAPRAYDYLVHGIIDHSKETLFAGVFQLRGGELLDLDTRRPPPSRLQPKTWYALEPKPFEGNFNEAKQTFSALFYDAVHQHLRADVDVGSCLSGGLDSSSLVCAMDRELKAQGASNVQKTFSAISKYPEYDERKWIELVRARTKIQAFFVEPEPADLLSHLERLIWHQDEPFTSTSMFAQWKVYEMAREHGVQVMLDGQGADEQLLGYASFFSSYWSSLLKQGKWTTLNSELKSARQMHGLSARQQLTSTANDFLPRSVSRILKSTLGLQNPASKAIRLAAEPNPEFVQGRRLSLNSASRAQIQHTNLPMLLHWADRNSMAHGVEARVPFLDHRLVEFVVSVPDRFKIHGGVSKYLLRESLSDLLPAEIQRRQDKMGFVTPESSWIRKELKAPLYNLAREAVTASPEIFHRDAVEQIQDIFEGRKPFSPLPWRTICFGQWLKTFSVSTS